LPGLELDRLFGFALEVKLDTSTPSDVPFAGEVPLICIPEDLYCHTAACVRSPARNFE
jgi:hypothetical protein